MCELSHVEKCLDNMENRKLVSTAVIMIFIYLLINKR